MSEPAKNLPLVTKPPCNPTYAVKIRLANGEKVCMPKLQKPIGAHKAGFEPVPNKLGPAEDEISPDQFNPASSADLTKVVVGKAEYSCKTKTPATEQWIVQRDVSVTRIPNESEENARARLEQAARDLAKTITGCHDVKFERLQPIVNGHTKSAASHSKPTTVIANKCDGEWATRPVCRK